MSPRPRMPNLGEFAEITDEAISRYAERKALRLTLDVVIFREHLSTETTKVFTVKGDHGRYLVWLLPHRIPHAAACSRGGIHELLPPGELCTHEVAADVEWELMERARRAREARKGVAS